MDNFKKEFMDEAVALAAECMKQKTGGPFGCVVVKNGKIIGRGRNKVSLQNDPTAHAEVVAIREACKHLNSFQLTGCEIYTSCEPCPMCLGAIYWARPDKIYYAADKSDAADAGFDDSFIYHEIDLPKEKRSIPALQCDKKEAVDVFRKWISWEGKIEY